MSSNSKFIKALVKGIKPLRIVITYCGRRFEVIVPIGFIVILLRIFTE